MYLPINTTIIIREVPILMFTEPFMQRALLAALLLGPLCALLGVFVVARRMAFFSDTISHGALTGVALGFWIGLTDMTIPMIVFSLLVALAIIWLKEQTQLLTDTIMALLLSGSVALGILILGLQRESYVGELHRYLFGDILAVGPRDVLLSAALFVLVMAVVFSQLSSMVLMAVHDDLAHVCGIPMRLFNYGFIFLLTVCVAVTINLVGIILVTALIVIPPATARNVSRNLRQQLLTSLVLGWIGGVAGIVLSYEWEVACGPTIVLTLVFIFLLSIPIGTWRKRFQAASQSA